MIVVLDNISYVHNAEDWFVFNGSNLSGSKAVTVDLNGKTIEANGVDGVVYAINGAQITIDGSDNGSGIVAVGGFFNTAEYAMAVWSVGEGTKVIINGGRYTQRVSGNDSQYDMIYAADKAVIEILDGEFTSVTPKWTLNVKDDTAAQFLVKGGRFTQYNPAESTAENPTANFCAPGFVSVKDGANYIVISQDDAAVAEATLSDGSTGKYLTCRKPWMRQRMAEPSPC